MHPGKIARTQVVYMGNIIDEAITLPTPVALSSAHAEYQTGAVTMVALIAATMLIQELQGHDLDEPCNVPVIFDSQQSAIAMGESVTDSKLSRHILRRYHFTKFAIEARYTHFRFPAQVQLANPHTKNLSSVSPTYVLSAAISETPVQL
jgi:hypothetical protein